MTFKPDIHHRRSLRLKGYDYAQAGAYFITICTQSRACLFGHIDNGQMQLNDAGRMVNTAWHAMPALHPGVETDAFVVMPNHVHGVITLVEPHAVGAGLVPALDTATTRVAPTVGNVVGAFKSRVTVDYIRAVKTLGWPSFAGRLWQRNYYEHIIRDENSLAGIRKYIDNNPLQWALDRENPTNIAEQPYAVPRHTPLVRQPWEEM